MEQALIIKMEVKITVEGGKEGGESEELLSPPEWILQEDLEL